MTVSSPSQHLLAGQLRAELSRRAVTDRVAHAGLALDIEPFGDLAKLSDSELAKRLSDCRDDRIEIDAAPAFARGQFESVAAVIPLARLTQRPDGQWVLKAPLLREYYDVDASEPFREQPVAAVAAASLLSSQVVFTAWHIATSASLLKRLRFVFGYRMDGASPVTVFPPEDVYEATFLCSNPRRDIAAFQLDRPVPAHRTALPRHAGKVADGEELYVIGYPVGLPAKFAGNGRVLDNTSRSRFRADLDVMGANSGSPVFSLTDRDVVGVVSSGPQGWTTVNGKLVSDFCHDPNDVPIEISRISNLQI